MRLRGRHYETGEFIDVIIHEGMITAISAATREVADRTAGWIAPALFDLQINGCLGISFNSPELTLTQVEKVIMTCAAHGIGGLLPTLVTNSFDAIQHGFKTLRDACEQSWLVASAVPGFHLEGPYIAGEDGPRGAHPKEHVRDPDWDEFSRWQDAAGGRIRLVTLAPERPGALSFIERAVASGVVVAIGHTAANPSTIRDAIQAGARLSTHIGNGSHAVLPRHENYIWEQLAADMLWASVIPDGNHLPEAILKCIVRCKTTHKLIITCDASSLAGLPAGRYAQWGSEFEVQPGGRVVVPGTPFLAGSGVFTDHCIGHMIAATGVSLADAIHMASRHPQELLGLPIRRLEVGQPGSLILFDWEPGQSFRVHGMET